MKTDLKALHLFKKAKSKESLGGFILGLGIGGTVADLVMGLTSEDKKYPTAITYAGVGLMAVSIPILSGRKKMIQESVDIYNTGVKDQKKTLGDNFELNIVNNTNGVGFQINF
jgi:dipeptide/tripeptide permease